MASVRKRKWTYQGVEKESWIVDYIDLGGVRRTKTFKRKKDADAYRLKVENEIERRDHVAPSQSMKVKDAAEEFIRDCERRRRVGDRMSGSTLKIYTFVAFKLLTPSMGNRLIVDVTSDDIQTYFNELADRYASRTAHTYAMTVKLIFDFFCMKKWTVRNVARDKGVRLPPKLTKPRAIPSKAELAHMLKMAAQRARNEKSIVLVNRNLILKLGIFGGLRAGEMAALEWKHIDFDKETISIKQSESRFDGVKTPKTRAGVRTVPLSQPIREALIDVLRYWQAKEDAAHLAFPGIGIRRRLADGVEVDMDKPREGFIIQSELQLGKPLRTNSLARYWEGFMLKCGMVTKSTKTWNQPKYTLHDMRHVAASLFIESGLPAMNLKSVIGHASVSTTYNVYGHMFPDDTRIADTARQIAEAISLPEKEQIGFIKPPRSRLQAARKQQQPATN